MGEARPTLLAADMSVLAKPTITIADGRLVSSTAKQRVVTTRAFEIQTDHLPTNSLCCPRPPASVCWQLEYEDGSHNYVHELAVCANKVAQINPYIPGIRSRVFDRLSDFHYSLVKNGLILQWEDSGDGQDYLTIFTASKTRLIG